MSFNQLIFEEGDEKKQIIHLSKAEYRKLIKEAYKEGLADALQSQDEGQNSIASSQQAGRKEEEKEVAKAESHTQRALQSASSKRNIVLLRAKAIFPLDLFPDSVIIDTTKISIIHKLFFYTEHVTTVPLIDLADAVIQTAFFLASLKIIYIPKIESPGMIQPVNIQINNLWRNDAIRAKNIIKGVIVARSEGIAIDKLNSKEIAGVIEKLGENKENV